MRTFFARDMRKYFITRLIFIVFLIFIILPPVQATESTPSSKAKEKLEALKQAIASKAAKLKQQMAKKLQNKAFVGVVESKSVNSLTLAARSGTLMVSVSEDTTFQDTSAQAKSVSLKNIKEGSLIATLGDVDDAGVLHAKKVIVLPQVQKDRPQKQYFWGQIISESFPLITIKNKEGKITSVTTSKIESQFKNNDLVIITGIPGKNDILEAKFLYVIPQSQVLKPKLKVASPSATLKPATPSGKKR